MARDPNDSGFDDVQTAAAPSQLLAAPPKPAPPAPAAAEPEKDEKKKKDEPSLAGEVIGAFENAIDQTQDPTQKMILKVTEMLILLFALLGQIGSALKARAASEDIKPTASVNNDGPATPQQDDGLQLDRGVFDNILSQKPMDMEAFDQHLKEGALQVETEGPHPSGGIMDDIAKGAQAAFDGFKNAVGLGEEKPNAPEAEEPRATNSPRPGH